MTTAFDLPESECSIADMVQHVIRLRQLVEQIPEDEESDGPLYELISAQEEFLEVTYDALGSMQNCPSPEEMGFRLPEGL